MFAVLPKLLPKVRGGGGFADGGECLLILAQPYHEVVL